MWKRSSRGRLRFRARLPSNFQFSSIVKMKPELSVPLRGRSGHDSTLTERVSKPSAGQASPHIFRDTFCSAKHNTSCRRAISQTCISCETSLKIRQLKMWESEAFVRDFLQNLKVEDVKTKLSWKTSLSCETSFKFSIFKYSEDEAWTFSSTAGPIRPWFDPNRTCFETIRRTS